MDTGLDQDQVQTLALDTKWKQGYSFASKCLALKHVRRCLVADCLGRTEFHAVFDHDNQFSALKPIHRPALRLSTLKTSVQLFETGIKVIDLLIPYRKGGKIGLFGGAGVGISSMRVYQE